MYIFNIKEINSTTIVVFNQINPTTSSLSNNKQRLILTRQPLKLLLNYLKLIIIWIH